MEGSITAPREAIIESIVGILLILFVMGIGAILMFVVTPMVFIPLALFLLVLHYSFSLEYL